MRQALQGLSVLVFALTVSLPIFAFVADTDILYCGKEMEAQTSHCLHDGTKISVEFTEDTSSKCATPTIVFQDGTLIFDCMTKNAEFHYSIKSGSEEIAERTYQKQVEFNPQAVYIVTCYATANGYTQSDIATETITIDKSDVNNDGAVDISDVNKVISVICGNTPTVVNSDFPEPWTLWNGHVVIYKEEYGTDSATIVLLSREENNVYSANKTGSETEAQEYANNYIEEGLDGWEIPDESIGELLRDNCNEDTHLKEVNALLDMPIVPRTSSGNYRYLCEGATKTFAFVGGTSILEAGKTKRYPLRLVKWIKLYK